jgi:nitroimidazol reductase NimA-like FMN-containing flavoprotein (pyridoxamine 5'-phosphate oxidase superfamily)
MTREEREAFLTDVHVGVMAVERPERAPLTVPIWYTYEPEGVVWIVIETGSLKERLLKQAGRFTLCAQSESPPYKFVSVEGPIVAFEPSVIERDETSMAERYLGPELGASYIQAIQGDPTNRPGVVVKMRPEKWITSDFAKQFGTPSTR